MRLAVCCLGLIMGKEFTFHYNYHKLRNEEFMAERGVKRASQYKIGEIVDLNKKGELWGKAEIYRIHTGKIRDLTSEAIRQMISHGDFTTDSPRVFMEHVNRHRHFKARLMSLEDTIAVFWLRKVRS